ncbi:acyl carrier protein phosphodiesterase [Amphritea balenae]|uniref:DUF479 domain-containing protein n=1 Tax=Amphritea balenae TaxID=452629 RepID=A0A3P1SSR5_9GAMM|nr:ACP phosphodiesterase [Amphritea balenae]RRC99655.1 DUF479 domain-containing protein [Amphritea balenae]GGK78719.1 ACP phosphodiesterase [Amphritea balenae]
MNFFAHLVLSEPNVHSRVGNLLGDFARGIDTEQLHPQLKLGLQNHRRIDQFTDQHPKVLQMKRSFTRQRRRFAGIALDVLFDHFLLQHWAQLSPEPKAQVIEQLYADLQSGQSLMPERMQQVTSRLVEYDWFRSYESLDGVAYALERIATRIRFPHEFSGIGQELELHYEQFDAGFQLFIVDLLRTFPAPLMHPVPDFPTLDSAG